MGAARRLLALGLVALASAACSAEGPPSAMPPDGQRPLGWVDVRLAAAPRVVVSASGPVTLTDGDGRVLDDGLALPPGSRIERRGDSLALDGHELTRLPCELRPRGTSTLRVEGKPYRGLLRVEPSADDLLVLNRLRVDDYLLGVLPGEMPDRFGIEALKAQAVAARSYALAEQADRDWLYPDPRSQVYGGMQAETPMATEAIRATAGEVLSRRGKVITAWFHSTCGGVTAPARDAFEYPPVGVMDRAVACPDCVLSPTFSWTRRVPGADVCAALDLPGRRLDAIRFTPERFPGRPERITVGAGGREVTLSGARFRRLVSSGRPFDGQLLSTRWSAPARIVEGDLLVEGHGWGHGVGLCQYGAGGYASRGARHRAILDRYYPGAELVRLQ